ncbi:hypothetical protein [Micromonospora sp. DT233]|uniref:hypothetical protein n=1 Tax=Micromonospora sp. DT233 TaxID=3393432 RepID=UPI003CEC17A2
MQTYPQPTWLRPHDPAESPGPIPSVIARFGRDGRAGRPSLTEAEREASRYTVVLVPPEAAEALGDGRSGAGLQLFLDDDWDHQPAYLDEAVKLIEEACGEPVVLIEHRSDLTYWTAQVRPGD